MINKVKQLLLAGIDGEALIREISARFFESVEDNKREGSKLFDHMDEYGSLRDFFSMEINDLDYDDTLLLDDLMDDMEYALQLRFDLVEDSVKKELIEGKYAADVRKEVRASGIIPFKSGEKSRKLTEDEVEEMYMDAFREFDDLRGTIFRQILQMSPVDLYEKGNESIQKDKKDHRLLMDERDFMEKYREHFDMEKIQDLFARSVYEAIHFHRRYELEYLDLSDQPKDPDEDYYGREDYMTDEEMDKVLSAPTDSEGILEPVGDLDAADYTYVYELLNEYTGHRVLPSDDERVSEAYWSTYADDMGDMLGMYMIQVLEETIRDLNDNLPLQYDSLAKFYHWDMDQRKDPEVILTTCDKISYALSDLQEHIWMDFNEANLMPYYVKGEKLTENFDYTGEGKKKEK